MTDKNETVANDSGNAKSKRRYDEENDILDESSSKHTKTIPDKKEDEKKIVGYECNLFCRIYTDPSEQILITQQTYNFTHGHQHLKSHLNKFYYVCLIT